ncbi:MAG TPA: 8-oxo-dGTP diphosphatase [Ktedonobacterales bacterium]|nr:8-oxo-dGTP diphosphatase [Ktedonobacterales bacterium]
MMALAYTICFCYRGDLVLMLHRNRPPNQGRWNGLGGKIQPNETPFACVRREMIEEAGIDLAEALSCRFAGIVTWLAGADPTSPSTGMYAFLAELSPAAEMWEGERVTREGRLCWKPLAWVCDLQNTSVVENIPHFLPPMFSQRQPQEYYCDYRDGTLFEVHKRPLPEVLKVH